MLQVGGDATKTTKKNCLYNASATSIFYTPINPTIKIDFHSLWKWKLFLLFEHSIATNISWFTGQNSFPHSAPHHEFRTEAPHRIRNIHKIKFWSLLNPIIQSRKNSECVADDTCRLEGKEAGEKKNRRRKNPRGQCDKNKLSPGRIELTYTPYVIFRERKGPPRRKNGMIYRRDAFIQKRIDCANQIGSFWRARTGEEAAF